jgi:hypothetical protein
VNDTLRFEVTGETREVLKQKVRDQCDAYFAGENYTYDMYVTPAAHDSQSGRVIMWEASVTAETTQGRRKS